MPPIHSQLMHHPSTCADEWRPTPQSSLQKVLAVSLGYAQNEAQIDHPQGIF